VSVKRETVLVIGDCLVDENWLVARHRSLNNTNGSGEIHYISKHGAINQRMTSLGGVPTIVDILGKTLEHEIIGFSAWNKNDTDTLQCIICTANAEKKSISNFRLTNLKEIKPHKPGHRICPYSNNKCSFHSTLINLAKTEVSTNRIMRVYEGHAEGTPNLLYRFDWEFPYNKAIDIDCTKFSILKNKNITDIIIDDHNKGVINQYVLDELIKAIPKNLIKEINWYIRSKVDKPQWLKYLLKDKNIKIKLNTIDYKIAQKKGPRRWNYNGEIGRASLELLGELSNEFEYKDGKRKYDTNRNTIEKVAVLLDDNKVVAKDNDLCFNLYSSPGPKQLINIGRTTVFFAALIVQNIAQLHIDCFGKQCNYALYCSFEWSKISSQAWKSDDLRLYGDSKESLSPLENDSIGKLNNYKTQHFESAWDHWDRSWNDLGIIRSYLLEGKKQDVFQIWRGEGALEGYISVGGRKRDEINHLLSSITNYCAQPKPSYPYNCLLLANPGWGKSFLAKSIAKHLKMNFVEFSLSQMATQKDLVDCFDSICSQQNRFDDRLLIFIDEVNCEIEGSLALGLLLNPIWDGAFIREGKLYRLLPAVWIFAATDSIENLINKNKGLDFVSRINGPIIRLDMEETDNFGNFYKQFEQLKRDVILKPEIRAGEYEVIRSINTTMGSDQVYIGVSLLNRIWGPISEVEEAVLELFSKIVPINGIRSIEFFVRKFKNIQGGEVYYKNMPSYQEFPELRRHIILPPECKNSKPDHMIKIID
jgi:ATPase related to the helicase subunit of the Holliday junction resolvase